MRLLIKYPMKLVHMARKFWNEIHDSKHEKKLIYSQTNW